MYYGVVSRDGRESVHAKLPAAKADAQKRANASGEEVNVYHKYDSGKTKALVARVYPAMRKNPTPERKAATVYEVIQSQGKGKPWAVRVATDDRAKARAVLDYLRASERGSFLVREVRADTYRRNPRGVGGIGYWSFVSPETGETMRYASRERAETAARKIAKRTLSRITVRKDREW